MRLMYYGRYQCWLEREGRGEVSIRFISAGWVVRVEEVGASYYGNF